MARILVGYQWENKTIELIAQGIKTIKNLQYKCLEIATVPAGTIPGDEKYFSLNTDDSFGLEEGSTDEIFMRFLNFTESEKTNSLKLEIGKSRFKIGGSNGELGIAQRVTNLEGQILLILSRLNSLEQATSNLTTLNNVFLNSGEQTVNITENRIALVHYVDYFSHKDNPSLFSYNDQTHELTFYQGIFGFSKSYTFSNTSNQDRIVTVRTKNATTGELIKSETYIVPNGQGTVEGILVETRDFSYTVSSVTNVETTIQCDGVGVTLKKAILSVVGK